MNSYYMHLDVRDNMNESVASHWSNKEIKRKLNAAQAKAAMAMYQSPGEWFLTSTTVTPVASVITLPTDCVRPAYLEHKAQKFAIPIRDTVRERRLTRQPSPTIGVGDGDISAYMQGNTIEINKESFSDPCTLWYNKRVVEMVYGTGDTGSSTTSLKIKLDDEPSLVDDYYNGITIDYLGGTGVSNSDTISDYAASTRILTVTTTVGTDTIYGTVSQVPPEGHSFIVLEATCDLLAKPSSAIDPKYFEFFNSRRKDAWKQFVDFFTNRVSASMRTRIAEMD